MRILPALLVAAVALAPAARAHGFVEVIPEDEVSVLFNQPSVLRLAYETPRRANTRGTPRLMQLLNPGFDSVLKAYVDPNAKKTIGLPLGGVRLAGGETGRSSSFRATRER